MKSYNYFIIMMFAIVLLATQFAYSSNDTLKFYSGEVLVVAAPDDANLRFSDKKIHLSSIANRDFSSASEVLNALNVGTIFKNSRNETVLSIRGFDRKQVAFFFDGVPLNAPNDGFADIDIIPATALALVSISKASISNSYGVNAMGAAINLVSNQVYEPFSFQSKIMYGTTSSAEFSSGGSFGKFTWLLGADYSVSEGFVPARYQSDVNILETKGDKRSNSEFNKYSFLLKTAYNYSENSSITALFLKSDGSRNVPINVYSNRKRFWRFTDLANEIVSASYKSKLSDKFSFNVNTFISKMYNKLRAFDDSSYSTQAARSSFNSVFDDYSAGLSLNATYALTDNFSSQLFVSYKNDNHTSQSNTGERFKDFASSYFSIGLDNRHTFGDAAFYFSAAYDLLTPLKADTIDALSNIRDKSDAYNFSIGYEYYGNYGTIYSSVSNKTRFPTLKELYSEFMGRNEPNPDLKPEKLITAEFGIKAVEFFGASFAANIFLSKLSDLIQYFPLAGGIRKFDNIGETIFYGAELSVSKNYDKYGINFDYRFLSTRDLNSDTTKFEDKPNHFIGLNIFAILPYNLRLDVFNNIISERYSASFDTGELIKLDMYYLLNLRVEYKLPTNFYIFANANNITNSYYESVYGFPAEGRNFSIGIRYQYK